MTMTKQADWMHQSEALSDYGRLGLLRQYRQFRRFMPRNQARLLCMQTAHGVWMAKNGWW